MKPTLCTFKPTLYTVSLEQLLQLYAGDDLVRDETRATALQARDSSSRNESAPLVAMVPGVVDTALQVRGSSSRNESAPRDEMRKGFITVYTDRHTHTQAHTHTHRDTHAHAHTYIH